MTGQNEFLKLLRQVHMHYKEFYSRRLSDLRLTPPQYMTLMILMEEGERQMHDLAESLQVSTSAVTNLVDKIEAAGYARRSPHPTDRRALVIALTPEGRRVLAALQKEGLALLGDVFGTMPAAERQVIERFYRNLLSRLDADMAFHASRPNPRRGPR